MVPKLDVHINVKKKNPMIKLKITDLIESVFHLCRITRLSGFTN